MNLIDVSAEENNLRLKRTKVACIASSILIPLGSFLDYLTYPEFLVRFGIYRIAVTIAIGLFFLALFVELGKRHLKTIGILIALLINAFFCLMIFETEGALSPYVLALNLIIMGAGIGMIWSATETAFVSIASIAFYFLACLFNHNGLHSSGDWNTLLMHMLFLGMTSVVACAVSFFNTRSRENEYSLRSELQSQNEKLTELDKLKSNFFANVSHELRTPLTLILSPIQDLLQRPDLLSEKVATLLRTARDNALRLLKLVNDLLEVIKLEEGKKDLHLRPIDVNAFVGGLVDSMAHLADARGIRLEKRLIEEPATILADNYALERIFLNLLSNAIKFTNDGGSVEVSCAIDEAEARIEISDTGIGIKGEDLPHIFDRFRQADGTSTRKHQGSGLGLALVKDLTEQMDGSILAKSKPGIGTDMIVAFPLRAEGADEAQAQDITSNRDWLESMHQSAEHRAALPIDSPFEKSESEVPSGKGPTLMIVDDEPDMRRYLVSILESDYRVFQVRDGRRAIELASQRLPDLMLLDLMLPEVDGLEICKRLKSNPLTRKIKIILLTARIDESAKIAALENGADDFLTKPFSRAEVEKRLENLLKTSQLEKELRERNLDLENALAELQRAQSNLIQSEKLNALGKMAAGLLHEVNNPLNYVIAALQMAKLEPEVEQNEELKDNLSDIDEGIDRVKNIVSDLHAFAYPSEVDKRLPFSLAKAIETAKRFTADECAGIRFSSELNAEDTAMGSQGHIVQVLVNLLSNAAKAIDAVANSREGKITIRTRKRGNRIDIFIRDNGIGMNEETLNRIFDPFFTTRDVGEGMGLGLSVCHTIVQNHGGTLEAESKANEGTEFRFDIPCASEFISKDPDEALIQPDDKFSCSNSPKTLPNA